MDEHDQLQQQMEDDNEMDRADLDDNEQLGGAGDDVIMPSDPQMHQDMDGDALGQSGEDHGDNLPDGAQHPDNGQD